MYQFNTNKTTIRDLSSSAFNRKKMWLDILDKVDDIIFKYLLNDKKEFGWNDISADDKNELAKMLITFDGFKLTDVISQKLKDKVTLLIANNERIHERIAHKMQYEATLQYKEDIMKLIQSRMRTIL